MASTHRISPARLLLATFAPGILVAATGVGAGDLLTASLAGSALGLGLLWAALVGSIFKWTLNEGLARWQLATGTTLLEGWIEKLGGGVQWIFLLYLLPWTFVTAGALVSACGVAGAGFYDFGLPLAQAKLLWGIVHSLVGLVLVWYGGFALFEKLMSLCIATMFVTVVVTAVLIKPDWGAVAGGLFLPSLPGSDAEWKWTFGLLGGVGGSVTLLSYGYWIREAGRSGTAALRTCRVDLAVGYAMTALFGAAMVVIGSRLTVTKSDRLALDLAEQLAGVMGPAGRWVFMVGFWGAVFSSLLGVWQSIPYLFADFMLLRRGATVEERAAIDYSRSSSYRLYLVGMATVPLVLLLFELGQVQAVYAVGAAWFMPFFALTLLIMNNHPRWMPAESRTPWLLNVILGATLLFFVAGAVDTAMRRF